MVMCLIEGIGELRRNMQDFVERQWPPKEPMRERLAGEVLDDQVIGAVLLADVVQRADVRVRQARDRASFTPKTFSSTRIDRRLSRQDLNGNCAIKAAVACFVDFTHPPCAEWREDFIHAKPGARGEDHDASDVRDYIEDAGQRPDIVASWNRGSITALRRRETRTGRLVRHAQTSPFSRFSPRTNLARVPDR
jgi:hypothetical protein